MSVDVKGEVRAAAVIARAGRRAQDQSSSLEQAGAQAGIATRGPWTNRSGDLTASLGNPRVEASGDTLRLLSDVPYARFVFYGTKRQPAESPIVRISALTSGVSRRVANDLVGE